MNSPEDDFFKDDEDDEKATACDADAGQALSQRHNVSMHETMRPRGGDVGQQLPRHLSCGHGHGAAWNQMPPHPLLPHGAGNYPPSGYGPLPPQLVAAWQMNTNGNNKKKGKKKTSDESYTSSKFSDTEKDALMETIGDILPIGNPCWVRVESACNAAFPTRRRHLENLRKQFNTCVGKTMPTGDPNCPSCVREAKRLKDSICQKSLSLTMGGDEDEDAEEIVGPPNNQLALPEHTEYNENNGGHNGGYETNTSNLTGQSSAKGPAVATPGTSSAGKTIGGRGGRDGAIAALVSAFLATEQTRIAAAEAKDRKERRRERRREKREDQKFRLMMAMFMLDNSKSSKRKRAALAAIESGSSGSGSGSESDNEDSDECYGSDASTFSKKERPNKRKKQQQQT